MRVLLRLCIVLLVIALEFSCASLATGQESDWVRLGKLKVVTATALTTKPEETAEPIQHLEAGTAVSWVEGEKKNNFYRVLLPKGLQGWIPTASATVVAVPPATSVSMALNSSPPCEQSLDTCPLSGCADAGSPDGVVNAAKRHMPEGPPVTLTFSDLRSLQQKADDLVGAQSPDLTEEQRQLLRNLTVSNGIVGEGSLVRLSGFIAQGNNPHPNSARRKGLCRITRTFNSILLRSDLWRDST
jgi:hypothetical protein